MYTPALVQAGQGDNDKDKAIAVLMLRRFAEHETRAYEGNQDVCGGEKVVDGHDVARVTSPVTVCFVETGVVINTFKTCASQ